MTLEEKETELRKAKMLACETYIAAVEYARHWVKDFPGNRGLSLYERESLEARRRYGEEAEAATKLYA